MRGADVKVSFAMLDMEMGEQAYQLTETAPGVYAQTAPALVMVGHWGLAFDVDAEGRRAVQRVRRRPGGRMTWLRLAAPRVAAARRRRRRARRRHPSRP